MLSAAIGLWSAGCSTESKEALGTLEWDQVQARAIVSQPIVEVLAKEGDTVASGQALLRLDTSLQEARVASLEASVGQAQWELERRQAGYRSEEVAKAVAEAEAAKSTVKTRQVEYDREKALYEKGASSERRVQMLWNQLEQAKAKERATTEQQNMLEEGYRVEEVEQAKDALAAAKAQLRHAREQLERYTITAERAGLLDSLPFKLGDEPPVGAVVSTVLAGEKPWARVYVPEPWLGRIENGDTVDVLVDGRAEPFPGRVRHISSNASFTPYYTLSEDDRSRLTYVTDVVLMDDAARKLPVGIPVRVRLRDGDS